MRTIAKAEMARRRHSTCPLHPSPAGVCPSCLRHRLSSLSSDIRLSPRHAILPRISLSRLLDAHSPNRPQSQQLGLSKSRASNLTIDIEDSDENQITMKEHIDLEFEQRRKSTTTTTRLWTKLQKWKPKQPNNNTNNNYNNNTNDDIKKKSNVGVGLDPIEKPTVVMRRRSCDTDTTKRWCSVDEPPRASWDGYMIARTIPRLAPMLSVIENAMINEQMLIEDFETEFNSVSESSSSQRRNSFDCSSSGKSSSKHRRAPVEIDSAMPVAKIAVSGTEAGRIGFESFENTGFKNGDSFKRKMLRILGFKNKIGNPIGGKDDAPNAAGINKSRSVKYASSTNDFENGLLKFQSTPPLSRNKKSERRSSTDRGVSRFG